jgi:voltage-dependent potassium channel beta subunit
MQYRHLGKWGVQLSTVGLGSWLTFGLHVDDDVAADCVKLAVEAGVNWFDTANAYANGQAEVVFGKVLKDYPRDSFVLATKVWAPMGPGVNDRGLSAKHIREQCHASLKRLQMDYIDLYQCHRPDPGTPVEETIRALEDLAREGKILYWGCSEWPASLIQEAHDTAYRIGARPLVSNQPRYSLLWRNPEPEVFPTTRKLGMGNVVFSPLAHGVLSGKYLPGQPPPEGSRAADEAKNQIMMNLYFKDANLRRVQKLGKLAAKLGITTAQLSLAWCLSNPAVTSVIVGATRVQQLKDNLAAADIELPEDICRKCGELFPLPADLAP